MTPTHVVPVDSAMGALDGADSLRGRVLIVEDNEVNRMIAREMLISLGLQVLEASDGRGSIDLAALSQSLAGAALPVS